MYYANIYGYGHYTNYRYQHSLVKLPYWINERILLQPSRLPIAQDKSCKIAGATSNIDRECELWHNL